MRTLTAVRIRPIICMPESVTLWLKTIPVTIDDAIEPTELFGSQSTLGCGHTGAEEPVRALFRHTLVSIRVSERLAHTAAQPGYSNRTQAGPRSHYPVPLHLFWCTAGHVHPVSCIPRPSPPGPIQTIVRVLYSLAGLPRNW